MGKRGAGLSKGVVTGATIGVASRFCVAAAGESEAVDWRNSCWTVCGAEAMHGMDCGHEKCLRTLASRRVKILEASEQCGWVALSRAPGAAGCPSEQAEHGNAEAASGRARSAIRKNAMSFCFIKAILSLATASANP